MPRTTVSKTSNSCRQLIPAGVMHALQVETHAEAPGYFCSRPRRLKVHSMKVSLPPCLVEVTVMSATAWPRYKKSRHAARACDRGPLHGALWGVKFGIDDQQFRGPPQGFLIAALAAAFLATAVRASAAYPSPLRSLRSQLAATTLRLPYRFKPTAITCRPTCHVYHHHHVDCDDLDKA